MKHARADYNRIQDPAGIIPDGEPVFLIRAQDMTGPDAVEGWARLQYALKGNRELAGLAMEHAERMREWQREHGSKVADAPAPGSALDVDPALAAEKLACRFHTLYERLAPLHGYETRPESATPWHTVPETNRRLMIAVCAAILRGECPE